MQHFPPIICNWYQLILLQGRGWARPFTPERDFAILLMIIVGAFIWYGFPGLFQIYDKRKAKKDIENNLQNALFYLRINGWQLTKTLKYSKDGIVLFKEYNEFLLLVYRSDITNEITMIVTDRNYKKVNHKFKLNNDTQKKMIFCFRYLLNHNK